MVLTRPDKGWSWVVLFASFSTLFVEGLFMGGLGIIHLALLDRFGESNMKTAMAGSLFVCMNTTGGILCSALMEKYSCRVVTLAGSLLFTVGLLISALPVSLNVVMFSYGVLAGFGASLTVTAAFIVIGYNFRQRINIANGIVASGMSFGSLVMPPFLEILRAMYGNTMIFVILGCLSLQEVVFGALYFPAYLEHSRKQRMHKEKTHQSSLVKSVCIHWLQLCKNTSFICITLYLGLLQLGAYVIYLHFPKFVTTLGFTSMQASYLLTIKGVFAFISRILLAVFVNSNSYNIDLTTLMFGTSTFLALASILLPMYGTSFAGLAIFCVFGGLYGDSVIGILNALNIDLVGHDNFAAATGIEFAVMGIGIFVGPTLVGYVIDLGGTYTFCFSITGCILLLAGFFSLIAGALKSSYQEELQHGDHVLDVFIEHNDSSEDQNLNLNDHGKMVSSDAGVLAENVTTGNVDNDFY